MSDDLFDESKVEVHAPSFPEPRPFQNAAHEALRQGIRAGHRSQMLMAPTGAGKCWGIDTPIIMADGTIMPVQEIAVGDKLASPTGGFRTVLSLGRGREMLYRVTPVKGDSYVVNESHLLSLRTTQISHGIRLSTGRHIAKDEDIVTVSVREFIDSSVTARHCLKGWRAPVERFLGQVSKFPVPPYILGIWLGDGTTGKPEIAKPAGPLVDEWIKYGRSLGLGLKVKNNDRCPVWSLTNGKSGGLENPVAGALRLAGVFQFKHIPHAYMTASRDDRLELIAGLLDTDGHMTKSGFDWISKHEHLANQLAFMCRSIGLACYVSKQRKGIKSRGFEADYWRCSISGDCDIVPCRQKKSPARAQKKRHLVHGISIEPIGVGDYYGFELDGDHLCLLGDFTVVHNTYLSMRVINEALKKNRRAIFVCDRRVLIEQTSNVADSYGLNKHGVIMADHWRYAPSQPLQIASAQTLVNRQWPDGIHVVVIDEAHVQMKVWVDYILKWKDVPLSEGGPVFVLLSATPFSKGLGKLASNLVCAATMHELTESGVLVPMRPYSCTKVNMEGAKTAGGEWTDEAAGERGMEIVGDVVAEWHKFGEGRKTIVFGATIAHCEEMCKQFNESGVMSAVFCATTKEKERAQLLEEYRKPDSTLRVLISVAALSRGFDVPDVGCICDVRPLRKSLSEFIQMIGRGARSSQATGKKDFILLDFSGNIIRFQEDFEDIYYNGLKSLDTGEHLDKKVRKDEDDKQVRSCPKCGFSPFAKRCISCGHEKTSSALIEHQPGEMREVMLGKRKAADSHRDLWNQVVTYHRNHGDQKTVYGRASHTFKSFVGEFQPKNWRIDEVPDGVEVNAVVRGKIRSNFIRYAKATGR